MQATYQLNGTLFRVEPQLVDGALAVTITMSSKDGRTILTTHVEEYVARAVASGLLAAADHVRRNQHGHRRREA